MRAFTLFASAIVASCITCSTAFVPVAHPRPAVSRSSSAIFAAKAKAATTKAAAAKPEKAAIETVKKPEFVKEVAERSGLTNTQATAAVNAFMETVADMVADKKKLTFAGFGTFEPRFRAARTGRNPQTGEELEIAATVAPGFSAAKGFKDKVKAGQ